MIDYHGNQSEYSQIFSPADPKRDYQVRLNLIKKKSTDVLSAVKPFLVAAPNIIDSEVVSETPGIVHTRLDDTSNYGIII